MTHVEKSRPPRYQMMRPLIFRRSWLFVPVLMRNQNRFIQNWRILTLKKKPLGGSEKMNLRMCFNS